MNITSAFDGFDFPMLELLYSSDWVIGGEGGSELAYDWMIDNGYPIGSREGEDAFTGEFTVDCPYFKVYGNHVAKIHNLPYDDIREATWEEGNRLFYFFAMDIDHHPASPLLQRTVNNDQITFFQIRKNADNMADLEESFRTFHPFNDEYWSSANYHVYILAGKPRFIVRTIAGDGDTKWVRIVDRRKHT